MLMPEDVADLVGPPFENAHLERLAAAVRTRTRRGMDWMNVSHMEFDTLGWQYMWATGYYLPFKQTASGVYGVEHIADALRAINGKIMGDRVAQKLLDE